MNPFTLFKLIKFDTKLDKHLEKNIFIYYLSFGTVEARLIRDEITSLHSYKYIIESRNQSLDDLTLWRFYISRRRDCLLQYYNWKYGTSISHHIYYSFIIILLQSDICNINEDTRKEQILNFQKIMDNLFKTKQLELSRVPNNIGTPSAFIIRDHIQIFTLHRKKEINDSLWRLRILLNWGLPDSHNKLCHMQDVCSQAVYSDLVNAYNQI